ncbi:hypothetical protein [Natrononativus amylolyticus]|uniref:hypothetical protein n=1 Tax=Natrononativus amylolyticus TaxID=2963434 RepID=UPI0020CFAB4D|nr:hypothetical protein [Natrononativus amylolyticus]
MALYFGRATRVFFRTLPFVALRAGVGVAIGAVTVAYFGVVGWLGLTLLEAGTVSGPIAAGGLLVATLVFLGGLRLAGRYVFYLVTAGHVAVIAHIVDTGEVPPRQLAFGTAAVRDHFTEASALFVVDQLVTAAIKQFNARAISFAGLVSVVPALRTLLTVLRRTVALAASYLDEAVLAYVFLHPEQDRWAAARDGVVLYAKTWKAVLGSTLVIVLGSYAVAVGVLLGVTPLAGVFGGLSPMGEILGWVGVAGMALAVYLGVVRPWVKTVVITTFLLEAKAHTPDSEAVDLLAARSPKFRELVANAEAEDRNAVPTEDAVRDTDDGFTARRPT